MVIEESVIDPMTPRSPNEDTPVSDGPTILERSGEFELYSWLLSLLDESGKVKEETADDASWDDNIGFFWGDQVPMNLPSFKAPIVINEAQTLILQEVSDLTDNHLEVYVQKSKASAQRDENAEKALKSYWTRNFIDLEVMKAALDAMILPSGFFSCTWDPLAMQGQGDVSVKSRDPRTVFPDPDAEDDDNWRYVMTSDVLDLVLIRQIWPDQGWRVKPEAKYSTKMGHDTQAPRSRSGRYKGPLYAPGSSILSMGFSKARAQVLTLFIYDDELEEQFEEAKDPSTGMPSLKSTTRQKYPNGRCVIGCNGVILFDGPNPYVGRFPIVRVNLVPTTHAFWPQCSPLQNVMEIYKAANRLETQVVENAIRLNNGILIADANSGLNPETFAGIPGQCVLKRPGTSAAISYPPPMPADMINHGARLRGHAKEVLGFPVSRTGAGQRGNISAELNETEISQGQSLSRLRGKLLYASCQKLVEMIFARMGQFYTTPRHLPYITGHEWATVPWNPIPDAQAYSVHVDPASFQVKSQTMLQRLYLTLAKMGKIPDKDLLKMLDVPNAEKMADENREQLMLQAMAKMKPGKGKK